MRPGVPAGMHCIAMPLAPAAAELPPGCEQWATILGHSQPLAGNPVRGGDELATIM